MNAQQEVAIFKQSLETAEKKTSKLDNYVPCANCGRIVYRNLFRRKRNKNNFCSQTCNAEYRNKNRKTPPNTHNVFTSRITKYHQTAWLVSKPIAEALQTKEWK